MSEVHLWDAAKETRCIQFLYHFLGLYYQRLGQEKKRYGGTAYTASKEKIDINTMIDELNIAALYLEKISSLLTITRPYSIHGCDQYIHIDPADYNQEVDGKKKSKTMLVDIFNVYALHGDHIAWIDPQNDRQINFIYAFIRSSNSEHMREKLKFENMFFLHKDEMIIHDDTAQKKQDIYTQLNLPKNAKNTKEKYNAIIGFFDLWPTSIETKKQQMFYLQEKWEAINKDYSIIDWTNNNGVILDWAFKYIKKVMLNHTKPKWADISLYEKNIDNMKYNEFIVTCYDLLSCTDSESPKMTFLDRLRIRGVIQKHRKNLKEQKRDFYLSIPVTEQTRTDFNKLKYEKRMNSEELLLELIKRYRAK